MSEYNHLPNIEKTRAKVRRRRKSPKERREEKSKR